MRTWKKVPLQPETKINSFKIIVFLIEEHLKTEKPIRGHHLPIHTWTILLLCFSSILGNSSFKIGIHAGVDAKQRLDQNSQAFYNTAYLAG
jgi:hypothetical protein